MITSGTRQMPMEPEQPNVEAAAKRLSFSHWGGKASGFEDSAAYLEKKAGEAFLKRFDGLANSLRDLAQDIRKLGEEARSTQKKYKAG